MGRSDVLRLFMLKAFFSVLLGSVMVAGHIHSQEVIVAHETRPEAPRQAAPSPEETPSEPPAPERTKPKSREKNPNLRHSHSSKCGRPERLLPSARKTGLLHNRPGSAHLNRNLRRRNSRRNLKLPNHSKRSLVFARLQGLLDRKQSVRFDRQ